MDHTLREWVRLGEKCGLAQAALDAQAKETRMDRTHIRQVMLAHWRDMQSAIRTGLEECRRRQLWARQQFCPCRRCTPR